MMPHIPPERQLQIFGNSPVNKLFTSIYILFTVYATYALCVQKLETDDRKASKANRHSQLATHQNFAG